ncbi:arylsulfatase [Tundrisphaera sp. TA3]|uniref:arylsulfatase n=1 Tax=Tundrisphaera sp. TA3 TaxID=3435775 RepID=UPI003EB80CA0
MRQTRRFPRLALALFAAIAPGAIARGAAPQAAKAKPNVVVILADDLGYSDIGCYGGEIRTPNLDRLASNGLRFTQFYNTARCWPSRAALMSGYYAQQVNRDPQGVRPAWAALLPQLIKPAGYRSYHSGKWHIDGPVLAGGFERSYELVDPDRNFGPKQHHVDDQPLPQPRPADGYYSTRTITTRALEWLGQHERGHDDEPFFLYLAYMSPHFPLHALPEDIAVYRDRYVAGWDKLREERLKKQKELGIYDGPLSARDPETAPGWNPSAEALRNKIGPGEVDRAVAWDSLTPEQKNLQAAKMAVHAAMVDRIDQEVGRVLEALRASGELENTVILFASDNGASAELLVRGDGHDQTAPPGSAKTFLSLGPGWSTASNTPFRLHKSWNHEGGIATPLIVHWPAGIAAKGEIRHTPGHLVDVVPTVLALAGATAPATFDGEARPPLPGRDLAPAFAQDVTIPRDSIWFRHAGNRALRVGDWKIVSATPSTRWELYDLATDRAELHDLAAQKPEKVKELAAIWERDDAEYAAQGATGKPLPGAAAKAAKKAARKKAAGR